MTQVANPAPHTLKITSFAKEALDQFLTENPDLTHLLKEAEEVSQVEEGLRNRAMSYMDSRPLAYQYYKYEVAGHEALEELSWQDFAAIRILDYLDNSGKEFHDLNLRNAKVANEPFKTLWLAAKFGVGGGGENFFTDMTHLFRQFRGESQRALPEKEKVLEWMKRYPSGLDAGVVDLRKKNKERIIGILARKIDNKEISSTRFYFEEGLSRVQKLEKMHEWWDNHLFHLRFAVRSPDLLNEMLDHTLEKETMDLLYRAEKQGIPFFVNPYYLSLLNVGGPEFVKGKDMAIRQYVLYSKELVEEFGNIVAWEKEDIVEQGKPNAAGWILPTRHNVHRRYPEVAILIPDTMGRACGGLCASCQRMYDFQSGNLNFDLDKLKENENWSTKLDLIMKYWEEDSRLRDILITGGDALMSPDKPLKKILDSVYQMAKRKKEKNNSLPEGKKHAEILRIRLGTRLPAYLPQRITPGLSSVLAEFKKKASQIGIKQFVIQTHFQSPMEVTPEAKAGIDRLIKAGWTVTNQLVFTSGASRRGHTARLRQVLNDVGVLPYYTFSVKGYKENAFVFATNARAAQEQTEEKILGHIPLQYRDHIRKFPMDAENMIDHIDNLRQNTNIPFLATDRNVLNLPGVGKSMTFRVIGITRDGRRILEFDHDHTRSHSPIIDEMGKFIIIESKSMATYLDQLEQMGENSEEYETVWGYSVGETEPRMSIYEYPEFDFELTPEITNFGG